jgi:hypothetical protein
MSLACRHSTCTRACGGRSPGRGPSLFQTAGHPLPDLCQSMGKEVRRGDYHGNPPEFRAHGRRIFPPVGARELQCAFCGTNCHAGERNGKRMRFRLCDDITAEGAHSISREGPAPVLSIGTRVSESVPAPIHARASGRKGVCEWIAGNWRARDHEALPERERREWLRIVFFR